MTTRAAVVLLLIAGSLGLSADPRRVTGTVNQLPSVSKRWALIIGINDYRDSQLTGLTAAERDAETLAAALTRYASFPEDQIVILATNQSETRQPTRSNILRYLSNLARMVPADGLFLVAFSGHGIERQNRAFLLPADAQVSDDIRLLEETAIRLDSLQDWIESARPAQVILLLDACRNDPMTGRSTSPNPLTTTYTDALEFEVRNQGIEAFATIYATNVGARAYESSDEKQGYFTWAIVQGLSGKAANAEGMVTLGGLIRYVQSVVPKRVALDIGRNQLPFSVIEGYLADDLVLSMTRGSGTVRQVVVPEPEPEPTRAADPDTVTQGVGDTPEGILETDDGIQPLPGWEWVKPDDPDDRTVQLKVGYQRGSEPNTIAPAGGWEWVNPEDKANYDVRLKEGLVLSEEGRGLVQPNNGWEWVYPGDKSNFEVRLKEGYQRGDGRGMIRPADGWEWVQPDDPKNYEVRRQVAYHFPAIATRVAGVRLYEGPQEGVELSKRRYQTVFQGSTLQYVNVELELRREKGGTLASAAVTCTYYRPDNSTLGESSFTARMEPEWTNSFSSTGVGWVETGHWNAGTYRISCRHNSNEVAIGTFEVR